MKVYIKNEILKNRRNHLFIISSGLILLAILLGSLLYCSNRNVFRGMSNQWDALWSQSGFYFSQIFFPILIATIIALNFSEEYKNDNIENLKLIPISYIKLIIAKFIVFSLITLGLIVEFNIVFFIIGKLINISDKYSFFMFFQWGIMGWIGSLSIIAIQMVFSCYLKKEISTIIISLMGSIGGFLVLLINSSLINIYPYSQLTIGLGTRSLVELNGKNFLLFIVINILYVWICYLLVIYHKKIEEK